MVAAPRIARKKRAKTKRPARPGRLRLLSSGAKALQVYLHKHGLSLRAFGEVLGISRGQVGMYTSGRSKPSLDLAVKIEQVTDGDVPCLSWVKAGRRRPPPKKIRKRRRSSTTPTSQPRLTVAA